VTQGAHGSVAFTAGGVSYTPAANYFGSDSFTYTISDNGTTNAGHTSTATVNVTINNVNDPPDAVNDTKTVAEDSGANSVDVRANDSILPDAGETLTVTARTNGAHGTVAIIGSGTAVSYTPDANYFGSDNFTYTISDGNGGTDSATVYVTVTPVNDAPTGSADPATQSVQFSDSIAPVTISAADIDSAGTALTATMDWKKSTDAAFASTPPLGGTGLSLVAATPGANTRNWTLSGKAMVGEGVYLVRFNISDGYLTTPTYVTITVTKEDTTIEYSGDTLKSTGSTATNSTASMNLAAVITEQADNELGNKLNTTKVQFTVYKFNDTAMMTPIATCTTPYITPTVAGSGTAACQVSLTEDNYTVKMELVLNSYYTAPVENEAITVVLPGTGMTTGGGWLNEPALASRSNFGFTVKYLKNGNIQGNSLYIYRKTIAPNSFPLPSGGFLPAGEYNWIIKSNAMVGMTQNCTGTTPDVICTGTFTGKNNITAVNRATGLAYSLGGNYNFQVDVSDKSEPGSSPGAGPDSYALRVWDTSTGTYYQLGTPAAQLAIVGGNIQVKKQ
jgi:hypothetical protein